MAAYDLTSDTQTRTLNWTVGPPDILEESEGRGNVFWINVYQNGPPWINLNSRAFNVTNSSSAVSTTSTTSGASITTTTDSPSQTQIATITTVATETLSSQSTGSSVLVDNRESLVVGLGVGLGLGIPLALIIGILVIWCCIARSRRDMLRDIANSAPGDVRMDRLDPPPEYRPHEPTAKEQQQGLNGGGKRLLAGL